MNNAPNLQVTPLLNIVINEEAEALKVALAVAQKLLADKSMLVADPVGNS
jgi:hypothetical protein